MKIAGPTRRKHPKWSKNRKDKKNLGLAEKKRDEKRTWTARHRRYETWWPWGEAWWDRCRHTAAAPLLSPLLSAQVRVSHLWARTSPAEVRAWLQSSNRPPPANPLWWRMWWLTAQCTQEWTPPALRLTPFLAESGLLELPLPWRRRRRRSTTQGAHTKKIYSNSLMGGDSRGDSRTHWVVGHPVSWGLFCGQTDGIDDILDTLKFRASKRLARNSLNLLLLLLLSLLPSLPSASAALHQGKTWSCKNKQNKQGL